MVIHEEKSKGNHYRNGVSGYRILIKIYFTNLTFEFLQEFLLIGEATLLVLNFAILVREYFAGFFFRAILTRKYKKDIKFRDLIVLSFILFKSLKSLSKFLAKLEK